MPMMNPGVSGIQKFIPLLKNDLEKIEMAARKKRPVKKRTYTRRTKPKPSLIERAKQISPNAGRNWFIRLSKEEQQDLSELRQAFLDNEFPNISIYKIYSQLIEGRYGCCYSTFVHWLRTGKTHK